METYTISAPELTRLLTISAQLKALSSSLSDKLTTSRALLISQTDELKELKLELTELKIIIEQSSNQSEALKATLAESEQSLLSLAISFDEYKIAASKRILTLQIVAIGSLVAGVAIAVIF